MEDQNTFDSPDNYTCRLQKALAIIKAHLR